MRRGGHALALVMVSAAVGITLAGVLVARLGVDLEARRPRAERAQAITLAHAACATGRQGAVQTPVGTAKVSRAGASVTVVVGPVTATEDCVTGRLTVTRD